VATDRSRCRLDWRLRGDAQARRLEPTSLAGVTLQFRAAQAPSDLIDMLAAAAEQALP
jgi:hypothetical protein